MKLKHKISLLVIGILLVVSLLISSSYALWAFSVSQESTNVVTTDCFEITFSDNHPISLEYAFPMEDSLGVQLTPYEFSVSNVCNHPADFQINLETLNTSTLDSSNIKADLNGFITSLENAESIEPTITNASSAIMLKEDTLAVNETKNYNLRLWVKEDAVSEEVENKSYASKVSIKAVARKQYDVAMLKKGTKFNIALKTLAGDVDPSFTTTNTSITVIERSLTAPLDSNNAVLVSDDGSANDIYAWFDNGTIYIYSEADKIYLNEDSSCIFYDFSGINALDLSYFDTSKVTDMSSMFSYMNSLTSLDVSHFDTSNVTDMSDMFLGMSNLTSLDVSHFDTSKVTNMPNMFYEMSNLTSLDVSHFDTSNVTDMSNMFYEMSNLTSLDVSHFDTSNATNMSGMFFDMNSLTSLDVSHFDTSIVTDMSWMFYGMNNLTSLDVSHFDTSNVTDMSRMFSFMDSLTSLDVSHFDTLNVTDMSGMFEYMQNLKTIYVSNKWNTTSVTKDDSMFTTDFNLIGGSGTTYDANHVDKEYARVDGGSSNPGYFTLKAN